MPEQTSQLSYEEARERLIEVVRTLEQGGTTLAESLALIWNRTRISNSLRFLRPRKRLTLLKLSQVTMT